MKFSAFFFSLITFTLAAAQPEDNDPCPASCMDVLEPVCGSNGSTYLNECSLRQASCVFNFALQILYTGACSSGLGTNPDTDGTRVCPSSCPGLLAPVCGSDGESYLNECKMMREACLGERKVSLLYKGLCRSFLDERKPESTNCDLNCLPSWEPVCGSDGKSYSTECMLFAAACKKGVEILPLHVGLCVKPIPSFAT